MRRLYSTALYTAHCTLHTVHCTQHTVHCTQHTVHCTQHTVHCTQHTVHCTQHTVHCTKHTVQHKQYNSVQQSTTVYHNVPLFYCQTSRVLFLVSKVRKNFTQIFSAKNFPVHSAQCVQCVLQSFCCQTGRVLFHVC